MQCLYCEKSFRDKTTLKDHMRKKQHRRINGRNHDYDRFYVINYLVRPYKCDIRLTLFFLMCCRIWLRCLCVAGVGKDLGGGTVWRWQRFVGRWWWVRPSTDLQRLMKCLSKVKCSVKFLIMNSSQWLVGLAGSSCVCRLSVLWTAGGYDGENLHTHEGIWYTNSLLYCKHTSHFIFKHISIYILRYFQKCFCFHAIKGNVVQFSVWFGYQCTSICLEAFTPDSIITLFSLQESHEFDLHRLKTDLSRYILYLIMHVLHGTRSLKLCCVFARSKVLPTSQTGELHPPWATPVSLLRLPRETRKQRGAGSTPC